MHNYVQGAEDPTNHQTRKGFGLSLCVAEAFKMVHSSSPQSFWHQGLFLWETNFPLKEDGGWFQNN